MASWEMRNANDRQDGEQSLKFQATFSLKVVFFNLPSGCHETQAMPRVL